MNRRKLIHHPLSGQSGQVLVAGVFILIILLLLVFAGFDVYNSIRAKFKIETAQEAAARAGATWQRDSLNLIGEINLVKACSTLLEGEDNWTMPLPRQSSLPGLFGQVSNTLRKRVLKSRIDVLTEMQTRISFIGPLIGLAAAQQAAKANGIANIGNFEEYINHLQTSSRYQARKYVNNYNWKEPYIGLLETISRNGVAVYPNSLFSASPNVYPAELGYEDFYNAIFRKYDEIQAAKGKAIYPQTTWSLLENFVVEDRWAGRFANPPWWNIKYNRVQFPEESEVFTLGVCASGSDDQSTGGNTLLLDHQQAVADMAANHLSNRDNRIYDSTNASTIPALNFFVYEKDTWDPEEIRQNHSDYDEMHFHYWFKGDVLRQNVKKRYVYEGPAAYVESSVDVGKTTAMLRVSGHKHTSNSIRIGSSRSGQVVSDTTDYRPGTIAKALGALDENTPPIALPIVLPVFNKVVIMPTYMPIPYNFGVLRFNDSALRRFLAWLSMQDNLSNRDSLPGGCGKYLEALDILMKANEFRYFGWNPNFDQKTFDSTWYENPVDWHKKRQKDPSQYQYNLNGGQYLPGYFQEPNIFTACSSVSATSGAVPVTVNGVTSIRHYIGNTRTYIVVDSNNHIITRSEDDPTFDPNCCGSCFSPYTGGSGGSGIQSA